MEEINLKDLFSYMLSKIFIIIIAIVLFLIGGIIYREWFKVPLYESYTTIVLTRVNSSTSTEDGITQNDLNLNQRLVSTYREIIRSRRILDKVIKDLELDMTAEELMSRISVTNKEDTELIRISVVDEDSENAQNIVTRVSKVFADEIVRIYSIENISTIDYASASDAPYNINVLKETVISLLLGAFVGCAIVFVMFYFDTTVKSVEEIERKLELPILGSVPKSHSHKSSKGGSN